MLVLWLLALLNAASAELDFEAYTKLHGKNYQKGSAEYLFRQELFLKAAARTAAQNAAPDRLWTAGLNEYSDWSEQELKSLRGWVRQTESHPGVSFLSEYEEVHRSNEQLPESVNWQHLASAAVVPNQAGCGSCWAVATAAVLDAHREIHQGIVDQFSAQELVNCVPNPQECGGQGGCKGATAELAMAYAQEYGLPTEAEVPYKGENGQCRRSLLQKSFLGRSVGAGASFGLLGWRTLPSNRELPLARALVEQGPIAVSVAGSKWGDYSSGIFNSCKKDSIIDHAVTLYGYGKSASGQKYWTIRNSWGPSWGENGYIRLLRHDDEEGYCGTDNKPEDGTGCKGGPPEVTVCGSCGVLYDSVVPHFATKPGQPSAASLSQIGVQRY